MTNKEIEKTLEKYEDSYAPWEMDDGDCPPYSESNMIRFGIEMYNKAIEAAAKQTNVNLDSLKIQ